MPKRDMSQLTPSQSWYEYGYENSGANKRARRNQKPFQRHSVKGRQVGFNRRVEAALSRMLETKRKSRVLTEQTISTLAGDPSLLDFPTDPSVGANAYQRIGNRITLCGLRTKLLLHNNGTGNSNNMFVRVSVLRVRDGAASSNTEVLNNLFDPLETGGDVTNPGNLGALIRRYNGEMLETMWDKVYNLAPRSADTGAGSAIMQYYRRFNEPLVYSDNSQAHPLNSRFVLLIYPLLANADESTGTNLEYSLVQDFYYKDK